MKTSYVNDAKQHPLAAWQWCWAPLGMGAWLWKALESCWEKNEGTPWLFEGKYSQTAQNPKKHWTLSNIVITLYANMHAHLHGCICTCVLENGKESGHDGSQSSKEAEAEELPWITCQLELHNVLKVNPGQSKTLSENQQGLEGCLSC